MTQMQRDIRTEELLRRSERLREELGQMLDALGDYVHELDHFIQIQTPEEQANDRTPD